MGGSALFYSPVGDCNRYLKYLAEEFAAAPITIGATQSATITVSNGREVIASPATGGQDDPNNTVIQAYNEIVNYKLLEAIDVDGGTSAAGTRVDNHMVFLDTMSSGVPQATATFSFSEDIIGAMSLGDGSQMFAIDAILGGPVSCVGAVSGSYVGARGLESNDANDFYMFVDSMTLDVGMRVTEPGDWVRVITVSAVPLSADAVLLPVGLGAFAMMRHRKKKAERG